MYNYKEKQKEKMRAEKTVIVEGNICKDRVQ